MLKKMLTDLDADGPVQATVEEEEDMFRWVTATLFTGEWSVKQTYKILFC